MGAAVNLASSVRHRGLHRSLYFLALAIGLPAAGELLATGPMKLLRHRTRPRVAGVPVGIMLGWYCAVEGSLAVAERLLDRLPLSEGARRIALSPAAAFVGTSLDLVLDPAGLDAGLWCWKADGFYAREVVGANGRRGIPFVNYLGWLALVGGVVYLAGRAPGVRGHRETGLLPVLVLLAHYLTAAAWAVKERRFRYLAYSAAFPAALLAGATRR